MSDLSSLDNVNEKGNACKRFLGFEDVSAERDAAALTEVVTGTLRKYNPEEKLISSTLLYRLLCLGCSGMAVPLNVSLLFWFSNEINESRIRVPNVRNCLFPFKIR